MTGKPRIAELAVVLVALVAGAYLFEGMLFVRWAKGFHDAWRRPWPQLEAARARGARFDTRRPEEVLLASRDLAPLITPSWFWLYGERIETEGRRLVPLSGVSRSRTLFCNESGEYVTFSSDEHGFRNPRGLWDKAPLDLLLIGDSFAQGACVVDGQDPASLLRSRYPSTVSLGYADNGPLTELGTLIEYGPALRPREVVWLYYEGNDLDNLANERRDSILMGYLGGKGQGLLSRQKAIDAKLTETGSRWLAGYPERRASLPGRILRKALSDVPRLRFTRRALGLIGRRPWGTASDPGIPLLEKILSVARRTAAGWGGKLTFVYLPEWRSFERPRRERADKGPVLLAARAAGIEVLDVTPDFRRTPDALALFPYRVPGHYNARGYRLVANRIARALLDEKKVKESSYQREDDSAEDRGKPPGDEKVAQHISGEPQDDRVHDEREKAQREQVDGERKKEQHGPDGPVGKTDHGDRDERRDEIAYFHPGDHLRRHEERHG